MEFVFLLTVIFIFDTSSAEVKAKFGCEFDSNYNLPVPAESTDIEHHIQPVWGEVGIATFENDEKFEEFSSALEKIYDMVLRDNHFNTIDNLLTFYNDYKKFEINSNRPDYLNDFLVQYKETNKPVDGAYLTIQIVNKMIEKYPEFTTQMLASSLSNCVIGNGEIRWTMDHLIVEPHLLPVKNYNDRVMGFIRFKIGNDTMGTVILDPAHELAGILVYWDSDVFEESVRGITRKPVKEFNTSHLYRKVGDYIDVFSLIYDKLLSREYYTRHVGVRTMCYIGKSFCSYENESRKPALVMPSHSMFVRSEDWNQHGGLFVDLYKTRKYGAQIALWGIGIKVGATVLKFKNTKQLNDQLKKDEQQKSVEEVGKALGKTPEEMNKLLAKIGIMISDHDFMSQMKQLYDWFSKGVENTIQPNSPIIVKRSA